jgi:osmotically-inducible protein OsmY
MKLILITTLIVLIASCSSTPNAESTGEYVDNSTISMKIKSKLLSTNATPGTSIDVESYKGIVLLSGFVDTKDQKERALKIAKETKGVKEVKDSLYVKSEVIK